MGVSSESQIPSIYEYHFGLGRIMFGMKKHVTHLRPWIGFILGGTLLPPLD